MHKLFVLMSFIGLFACHALAHDMEPGSSPQDMISRLWRERTSSPNFVRRAYISPRGTYLIELEALLPGLESQIFWGDEEVIYHLETDSSEAGEVRFFDRRAAQSQGRILDQGNRALVYDGIALSQSLMLLDAVQTRRLEARIWERRTQLKMLPPYIRSERLFGYLGTDEMIYVQAYRYNEKDFARVYAGSILNEQIQWRLIQVLRINSESDSMVLAGDKDGEWTLSMRPVVTAEALNPERSSAIAVSESMVLVPFDQSDLLKLIVTGSLPKPTVRRQPVVRQPPTPLDLVYKWQKTCELLLGAEVANFMRQRQN